MERQRDCQHIGSFPTHLTALGVIQNITPSGTALYSTFDGTPSLATNVLVKSTYYGDANLDGKIDGSDYTLIDNGGLLKPPQHHPGR